ncbi:uncharacterized protein [Aristolochia californica]|uniref:uncharacterized protein isoform X2 n=1 Tax=Aristolochia californica TaxID=171875 RepID=UPI0035E3871C
MGVLCRSSPSFVTIILSEAPQQLHSPRPPYSLLHHGDGHRLCIHKRKGNSGSGHSHYYSGRKSHTVHILGCKQRQGFRLSKVIPFSSIIALAVFSLCQLCTSKMGCFWV